jgi:ribonuclease HI
VSDSKHVVNGMTNLVEKWRDNGWRNSRGKKLGNREGFQELDGLIEELEDSFEVYVMFWRVPRAWNEDADRLAKDSVR